MPSESLKLEKLLNLATEPSSERRRELLYELTDLFLDSPEHHTERVSWFFGDIIGRVAYDLEAEVRTRVAERLKAETAAPPELIKRLANDEIGVARPVIEHSPVLSQDDLVDIASRHSQGHLLAITKRPDIGERVSTVLVDRGDDAVVQGLVTNTTAIISDGSMQKVAARGKENSDVQISMLKRPDLPYELMRGIVAQLSVELREEILAEQRGLDRDQIDTLMGEVAAEQEQKLAAQKDTASRPEALIADLAMRKELTPLKLIEFAKQRKMPEFVCALAKLSNMDIETAQKVTEDRSGEGLALICRAGGLSPHLFTELVAAFEPTRQKSRHEIEQLLLLYEKLAVPTAQRILRFWRVRKNADKGGTAKPAA